MGDTRHRGAAKRFPGASRREPWEAAIASNPYNYCLIWEAAPVSPCRGDKVEERVLLYVWVCTRNTSFVIDGEAVLLGVDGRSDFNGLHSRKHDAEVQFYAFDILVSMARTSAGCRSTCARPTCLLLARRVDGIFLSDFEQGEIGPDLFRHACLMGLEGMVSKHRESTYRGGRYDRWIKVKNRQHPAFSRVQDQFG